MPDSSEVTPDIELVSPLRDITPDIEPSVSTEGYKCLPEGYNHLIGMPDSSEVTPDIELVSPLRDITPDIEPSVSTEGYNPLDRDA